ncbi:MAG: HesA/MoeB/ThiF family protein [Eudoraea sp.]|uniref:HesA/MoeB/ThiF family protein n=1 Tax=Eudoraea sp. TaxID=1979955 RepID=UPI003267791E
MNTNRYIRQTSLKEFGQKSQDLLLKSSVLVVGAGGLGIPVLQYLNAMGIGTLGIVEGDKVEITNLQRQVIYCEKDIGKAKLEVALEQLKSQNSGTTLIGHDTFLTPDNALTILADYDVIVDATDNFPTRYLINDACVILDKPFVYGALHGFEGHISVFNYKGGPSYRCLFPVPPEDSSIPNCNDNGVLGVIPGIVGTLQALEAVKCITAIDEVLSGKLLIYNGLNQSFYKLGFQLEPQNLVRSSLESSYEIPNCDFISEVSIEAFHKIKNKSNSWQLIDVRTKEEFTLDPLKEAINIPLSDLEIQIHKLKPQQSLYFICQSGIRSLKAVSIARNQYPDCESHSIMGGVNLWNSLIKST